MHVSGQEHTAYSVMITLKFLRISSDAGNGECCAAQAYIALLAAVAFALEHDMRGDDMN